MTGSLKARIKRLEVRQPANPLAHLSDEALDRQIDELSRCFPQWAHIPDLPPAERAAALQKVMKEIEQELYGKPSEWRLLD